MRECTKVVETIILATVLLACMNRESRAQDPCLKWTDLAPASRPSSRYNSAAVYDEARHVTMLFSGYNGSRPTDTWKWDGASWTLLPVAGPVGRDGHGMAYDSDRARGVLFGGAVGGFANDTWEWDGSTWTQQPAAPSELSPRSTTLAYDKARRETLLFGGHAETEYFGDTWAWDGVQWARRATTGPSKRTYPAMAYDEARRRVVLFGGNDGSGALGETWTWDGIAWSQKNPARSPTARGGARMVYDSQRQTILMFGGLGGPPWVHSNETWEWNSDNWARVETGSSPPARRIHAMAYDSDRGVVVVFGGNSESGEFLGDTWELSGTIQCPTVSQWGLIVMAGLVAAAGGSILHKRRAQAT